MAHTDWISVRTFASNQTTPTPAIDNTIVEFNNAGTLQSGTTGYTAQPNSSQPESIAVDSSGNVWYNSSIDATLHEIIGAATPVDVPLAHAVANNKVGSRP